MVMELNLLGHIWGGNTEIMKVSRVILDVNRCKSAIGLESVQNGCGSAKRKTEGA